jgi:hypothetical protein
LRLVVQGLVGGDRRQRQLVAGYDRFRYERFWYERFRYDRSRDDRSSHHDERRRHDLGADFILWRQRRWRVVLP